MDDNPQRQFRNALSALVALIIIGTVGFMFIEGDELFDAFYMTVITLATVGYGDMTPQTDLARLFTIVLIFFGFSTFAFVAQSLFGVLLSQAARRARQRKLTQRRIAELSQHYIICGHGEMVEKIVWSLLSGSAGRRTYLYEKMLEGLEARLRARLPRNSRLRPIFRRLALLYLQRRHPLFTVKNFVVVLTQDEVFGERLRKEGAMVIVGDAIQDDPWMACGADRARSIIITLDSDAQTLLAVLSARSLPSQAYITASVREDALSMKILRAGANVLFTPFDSAAQYINNATLRPMVNDFLNSLLFTGNYATWGMELKLPAGSAWVGRSLSELALRERSLHVLGLRRDDGDYVYAPPSDYILQEDETLIGVADMANLEPLVRESGGTMRQDMTKWQQFQFSAAQAEQRPPLPADEAQRILNFLDRHYIICGSDEVIRQALFRLNPSRPIVVVAEDEAFIQSMHERGFLTVLGDPLHDFTLMKTGIQRANAIMISSPDAAESVYSVFQARALNRRVLITATAYEDEMIPQLRRAGASFVVNPYYVAAQFILTATTRPTLRQFIVHTLFNPQTGLETNEIYVEPDSPWVGQSLAELRLRERFEVGVIGVHQADQVGFVYAPPDDYRVQSQDVLIVIVPMSQMEALRAEAYAHSSGSRPSRLRRAAGAG